LGLRWTGFSVNLRPERGRASCLAGLLSREGRVAQKELPVEDQKARALELLLDAWEAGLNEGIEPEYLATAAIFAALTDMVDIHGEDAVATMTEELPARVREGEFTLEDDDEDED